MFSTFPGTLQSAKSLYASWWEVLFLCISFSVKQTTFDHNRQLPEKFASSSASEEELPQQL